MSDETEAMPAKRKNEKRGGLRPRGKNKWWIIVSSGYVTDRVTGRPRQRHQWVKFDGSKREAAKKRTDILAALNKGEWVEPTKLTFGAWLTDWMDRVIRPAKRPRTVKTYDAVIKGRLVPALGDIPIQKLRAIDLEGYYLTVKKLAPATRRMHHAIISSALKKAAREGLVVKNVATLVEGLPSVPKPHERVHQNVWTADEARTFLARSRTAGPQWAAFFALALDSGARKSELAAVRWADLDFEAGKLTIMQQLVEASVPPVFGPPKTGNPRTIDLSPETLVLLREHKRTQAEAKLKNRTTYRDFGLIFAKELTDLTREADKLGDPLRVHNIGEGQFGRLIKAANVKRITLHGCRHTTATLLLQAGVPVNVISQRLGHARVEMTLSIYAHVLPTMQRDAAGVIGKILHG